MAAPIAVYGICQTGCNAAWVACYGAAGIVAGTVGPAAPPTILAAAGYCNAQQGVCMAACASMTVLAGVAEVTAAAPVAAGAVTAGSIFAAPFAIVGAVGAVGTVGACALVSYFGTNRTKSPTSNEIH